MNYLSVPKNINSYFDEMIIHDGKMNLNRAYWKLNHNLSISVKHLMNTYNVNHAMTVLEEEKNNAVIINIRTVNNWLITGYDFF